MAALACGSNGAVEQGKGPLDAALGVPVHSRRLEAGANSVEKGLQLWRSNGHRINPFVAGRCSRVLQKARRVVDGGMYAANGDGITDRTAIRGVNMIRQGLHDLIQGLPISLGLDPVQHGQ